MKRLFWLIPLFACLLSARAVDKITSVQVGAQRLTGIREARLTADGRVLIVCDGPKTNTTAAAAAKPATQKILIPEESLSDAFLQSWAIKRQTARALGKQQVQEDLNKAISSGLFRMVDGVVYDLRKPQTGWVNFNNIKVIQSLNDRAILNATPDTPGTPTLIFVRNLPALRPGTDRISFSARETSPPSRMGVKVMSRTYDCGILCKRADIPDQMLKEKRAFIAVAKH